MPCVTNINISYNSLTDECIDVFINSREYLPSLRIINVSHNKINERKVKNKL
jgi:Leucine-rich repeat (LRR) protein